MRSPPFKAWRVSLDAWNSCTVPSDVRIVTFPSSLLTFITWPSTVGGYRTGSQLVSLTSASTIPLHRVALATTTAAICLHGLIGTSLRHVIRCLSYPAHPLRCYSQCPWRHTHLSPRSIHCPATQAAVPSAALSP